MSWIHHRYVIAGGRCVSDGITTSDITSHTNGPYTAATYNPNLAPTLQPQDPGRSMRLAKISARNLLNLK